MKWVNKVAQRMGKYLSPNFLSWTYPSGIHPQINTLNVISCKTLSKYLHKGFLDVYLCFYANKSYVFLLLWYRKTFFVHENCRECLMGQMGYSHFRVHVTVPSWQSWQPRNKIDLKTKSKQIKQGDKPREENLWLDRDGGYI